MFLLWLVWKKIGNAYQWFELELPSRNTDRIESALGSMSSRGSFESELTSESVIVSTMVSYDEEDFLDRLEYGMCGAVESTEAAAAARRRKEALDGSGSRSDRTVRLFWLLQQAL